MKSILMCGAAGLVLSGVSVLPAYAQSGSAPADEARDTITVTARKKEESLQEVPLSVSAFSEGFIEDANLNDITDIANFTPGFQQQQAFGRDGDRPIIRGTSNILISEGKVGIFVDGVPFLGSASALDLNSFERVEIIRGPQSATFGRGTLSGAINYVTKKPTNEFSGRVQGTVAEWDEYEIFGSVSGPLIKDKLYGFVSAKYFEKGGDYSNRLTGDHFGVQTTTINAGLTFDATDDLEFGVRYIFTEDDDDHFAIALQDSSFNNCQLASRGYFCGEIEAPEAISINTDDLLNPGIDRTAHRFIGTADWDLGDSGFNLSGLFGYTEITERTGTDQTYDGTTALFITSPFVCANFIPNCVFGASPFNTDSETERDAISAEVRLTSPQDNPLRMQLGFFYFDGDLTPTSYGLKQTEFGYDAIGERSGVRNIAVFGGVEYDVTDKLTAGVELRYANDKITRKPGDDYVVGDFFPSAPDPTLVVPGEGEVRSATFNSVLPRFTLDYQANDNLLIYGVVSEGNSPGGFNPTDAPKTTYDEEKLWNYEIGFKSQLTDALMVNVSGYFMEYSNQVLSSTFTTGSGGADSFQDNVGDSEIWGLELESVLRLSDHLYLAGTYSYTGAEIVSGLNADQAILFGGAGCSGVDYLNNDVILPAGTIIGDGTALAAPTACAEFASIAGQQAPLVSKHQASLSANVDAPLFDTGLDWFFRTDFTYRSSFYAQVHNLAETGDSARVNFSGGLRKDGISLRFWLKNAFNDDTPSGILRYVDFSAGTLPNGLTPRAFAVTPSSKRQVGMTLTADF